MKPMRDWFIREWKPGWSVGLVLHHRLGNEQGRWHLRVGYGWGHLKLVWGRPPARIVQASVHMVAKAPRPEVTP